MATRTIGTGGDDTDANTWYNGRSATFTEIETGQLLPQSHAAATLNGKTTSAAFYGHLTCAVGDEHDGTANAVSGAGNARITQTAAQAAIRLYDDHLRVSWIEVIGPGNNAVDGIESGNQAAGSQHYVHHCIFHNDDASADQNCGGYLVIDSDCRAYAYRNIFYGYGGAGIYVSLAATGSGLLYNTIYNNNGANTSYRGGIRPDITGIDILYNLSIDNSQHQIRGANGTQDYNYVSGTVGEGANSLGSRVASTEFANAAGTTWASMDLRLASTATAIGAGLSASNTTYPEIDYAINDRSAPISGDWDIGAAQYPSASGATGTLAYTNAADTLAASGTTTITSALATTNAVDTPAAAGSTTVLGNVAKTEAPDTSAAVGTTTILGVAAPTNANDTLAASGSAGAVLGTVDATNANDTLAAAGTTTVLGALAYTNANDTLSAAGTAGSPSGTVAVTNGNDTLAGSGATTVTGSAAVTNGSDTSAAQGETGLQQGGGGSRKRKPFKSWDQRERERLEELRLHRETIEARQARENKDKYGDLPPALEKALGGTGSPKPTKPLSAHTMREYERVRLDSLRNDDEEAFALILGLL